MKARIRKDDHSAYGLFLDDANEVRKALIAGAHVESAVTEDYNVWTPLLKACYYGNYESAKILVEHGANINKVGGWGMTPLQTACNSNCFPIVKLLIDRRANINMKTFHWGSALHIACSRNATDCAVYLIQHGARVTEKNPDELTPLQLASSHTNYKIVNEILNKGSCVDEVNQVFVWMAKKYNNKNMIRYYIEKSRYPITEESIDRALLATAKSKKNTSPIISLLLNKGGNMSIVDDNGNSLLHLACSANNLNTVNTLLSYGMNPDMENCAHETPLMAACENRRVKMELLKSLMEAGASKQKEEPNRKCLVKILLQYKNNEKLEQIRKLVL